MISKSIGLGRLLLDGRHISGLRYALDEARIGACLQQKGIAAKLYSGKSEGRVVDIARQLARMRTDAYLFWTDAETLNPICQIAKSLKALRPNIQVLFWGSAELSSDLARTDAAECGTFLAGQDVPTITEILTQIAGGRGEMPGAAPAASPYLSGLLEAADVARLGLSLEQDPELTAQELAWLAKQRLAPETVVPVDARTVGAADLIRFCALFESSVPQCILRLSAQASSCNSEFFRALTNSQSVKLELSGNLEELPLEARGWAEHITSAQTESQRVARAALYGKNGNVALHTGFYFDAKQTPGIYHLEMPLTMQPDQRKQVYSWAAESMDIRSAAVLNVAGPHVADQLRSFQGPRSDETNGWPKHVYAISLDAETLEGKLVLDGVEATQQRIRYVALRELNESVLSPDMVTMVTTSDSADIDILVEKLDDFHNAGRATISHARYPVYFENACRWVGAGSCRLPMLRRVQVDSSMNLKSCRDAGHIGKVGDEYDNIIGRLKQMQQVDQVHRGCATCEVRDQCSQCSQLPESWGGRYCSIRKSHPQTALYFELYSVMYLVSPHLAASAATFADLEVSYSNLPPIYYSGNPGTPAQGRRPVLLCIDKQNFVWYRGTRKLVRLSDPLALMFEGWWLGATHADVIACLVSHFSVDSTTAESSLLEGLKKLETQGVIQ